MITFFDDYKNQVILQNDEKLNKLALLVYNYFIFMLSLN